MQLATVAAATPAPAAPRTEAAKALLAVPMGVLMTASMTAMTKSMAGQAVSRAELVAPLLAKLTPEAATAMMNSAIEGALALEPALAGQADAMRQAAAGVAALLAECAADVTPGEAQATLAWISTPMQALAAPLLAAALVLDPSLQKPAAPAPA
ncbi:MAG: hypothetical protein JWM98_1377 [Thermoleophilia bacterium]|nr:hypothetical protein [Thermoleophilia bacterium]